MAKRSICCALLAWATLAPVADAATWTPIGTSGFSYPAANLNELQDDKRIRFSDIAQDKDGNVYAICNVRSNAIYEYTTATNEFGVIVPVVNLITIAQGGITIFKTDGSKLDVKVSDANGADGNKMTGPITRLVTGGNGKVYGLMNWTEINWGYQQQPHRIFRIEANGTVTEIWSPGASKTWSGSWQDTEHKISGLAVGNDGNIYWTMNGASGYWKWRYLWRYNIALNAAEPSNTNTWDPPLPDNSARDENNGWGDYDRMFNLIAVDNGWFTILNSGTQDWGADSMSWDAGRIVPSNSSSNPGWGRNHLAAMAYDPVRNKLWAGGRGAGTPPTNIMSRWNGKPTNVSLYEDRVCAGTACTQAGIQDNTVWHANGLAPTPTPLYDPNVGAYWVSALTVNPADGKAWMSWGANANYAGPGPYGPIGKVYTMGPNDPSTSGDEGAPMGAGTSQVVALKVYGKKLLALAVNLTTGEYVAYSTPIPGCSTPVYDNDEDGDVDQDDFGFMQRCWTGNSGTGFPGGDCVCVDKLRNNVINDDDMNGFWNCLSGPEMPIPATCVPDPNP